MTNPLKVEALVKHYGSLAAVDGISFEIEPGELVGFIGPNGAGKSTTYRCIAGLQRPDSGRILIDGIDVHEKRVEALRRLAYVGQDVQLFQFLTGEELLMMVGEIYEIPKPLLEERIAEIIPLLNLEAASKRLVRQYSGGMARKLSIATALIERPPLLLMDESFAGLDPESTVAIRKYLDQLRSEGTAVLLSSHVLDMLERWVTRVIVLRAGKIVADNPRSELDTLLSGQYDSLTSYYMAKTSV